MIALIIQLLEASEHYGQSENIEIAKGKHVIAKTIKQGWKKAKRQIIYNNKTKWLKNEQ
jgi:hypothetical protein